MAMGLPERLIADPNPKQTLALPTFYSLLTVWILIDPLESDSTLILQPNISCRWLYSGITGHDPVLICTHRGS